MDLMKEKENVASMGRLRFPAMEISTRRKSQSEGWSVYQSFHKKDLLIMPTSFYWWYRGMAQDIEHFFVKRYCCSITILSKYKFAAPTVAILNINIFVMLACSLSRGSIGNNLPTQDRGRSAYTLPSSDPTCHLWDYIGYVVVVRHACVMIHSLYKIIVHFHVTGTLYSAPIRMLMISYHLMDQQEFLFPIHCKRG